MAQRLFLIDLLAQMTDKIQPTRHLHKSRFRALSLVFTRHSAIRASFSVSAFCAAASFFLRSVLFFVIPVPIKTSHFFFLGSEYSV